MAVSPRGVDPLTVFPPEIVLQILEHTPVSGIASLTAASKAWHQFIDAHQDAIYASDSKTQQPPVAPAISHSYQTHIASAGRQKLLARNWAASIPDNSESIIQVGNDPVWRFKADFKRRFFISTSSAGGLYVTDMSSGRILWNLPPDLDGNGNGVRPQAHLEYQDGMAVFDSGGFSSLEVWQTEQEGTKRGEFRRIAILDHECETRGFQLSYWTLCVVSDEGQGFVYDMTQRPPKLTTKMDIEPGAIGHLDQSEDIVIYSMGPKGYYAYNKESGAFLGSLDPPEAVTKYHIHHPPPTSDSGAAAMAAAARLSTVNPETPQQDSVVTQRDCLVPITVAKGAHPFPIDPLLALDDEWGAGMIDGDLFVGFSRSGSLFICSNYRKALRDEASLVAHSSIVECETDGTHFDLGGWLSLRNRRVMFEIQERIYIIALDDNNRVEHGDDPARASYSLLTSSSPQFAVPVSYMELADDGLMSTFTTLGWRQDMAGGPAAPHGGAPPRVFPTKVIRILSLTPNLNPNYNANASSTGGGKAQSTHHTHGRNKPPEKPFDPQAGLLSLFSMFGSQAVAGGFNPFDPMDSDGEFHDHYMDDELLDEMEDELDYARMEDDWRDPWRDELDEEMYEHWHDDWREEWYDKWHDQ
ncbi:hypothetical protein N7535_004653 [Penicillium sp. DV-2018c]|nr:hypothetical protein N7535_004653 [Penicillium sp. DV-2018c]